jgi:hypothetical protein
LRKAAWTSPSRCSLAVDATPSLENPSLTPSARRSSSSPSGSAVAPVRGGGIGGTVNGVVEGSREKSGHWRRRGVCQTCPMDEPNGGGQADWSGGGELLWTGWGDSLLSRRLERFPAPRPSAETPSCPTPCPFDDRSVECGPSRLPHRRLPTIAAPIPHRKAGCRPRDGSLRRPWFAFSSPQDARRPNRPRRCRWPTRPTPPPTPRR